MGHRGYSSELISALTQVLGQWTAPGFLTGVAAREGVHLDPSAIVVITVIDQKGPQRPSDLAAHLVTGASNISKITRRLTEMGLVVRCTDPEDGRAQRVLLTPAGEQVAAAFVAAGDGMVDELLAGWDETDRLQFTVLLGRFASASTAFAATLDPGHAATPAITAQPGATAPATGETS